MKKFLAILMAMTLLLSLCACGGEKEENPNKNDESITAEDNTKKDEGKKKAEKIGNINIDGYVQGVSGAFIYTYTNGETKLEGLVSADGSVKTDAKYYKIEPLLNCFKAETKQITSTDDFDAINSTIIIDAFGNELISEGYCMFESLSGKYISAAKVIEHTTDKSDFDIRLAADALSSLMVVQDDNILYNAEFHIYDITTGKKLDAFTLYESNINVYGEVISYMENGEWVYKNSKGESIPEDASKIVNLNGNYIIEKDDVSALCNAFGDTLFTFDEETDYVPFLYQDGYFVCKNSNTMKLAIFDESGKMVSAEFPVENPSAPLTIEIEGDFIEVANNSEFEKLYDFEGNLIKEVSAGRYLYSKENPAYYVFTNSNDDMTIFDTEGNILFEVEADDTYDTSGFLAYNETKDEECYFCLKDKDFTIEGEGIDGTYYVEVEKEDDSWEIVDTITGKTVLKGEGYCDYVVNGENVYFCVETEDGVYDFYKI